MDIKKELDDQLQILTMPSPIRIIEQTNVTGNNLSIANVVPSTSNIIEKGFIAPSEKSPPLMQCIKTEPFDDSVSSGSVSDGLDSNVLEPIQPKSNSTSSIVTAATIANVAPNLADENARAVIAPVEIVRAAAIETGENVSKSCIAIAATTANVAPNLPDENARAVIAPVEIVRAAAIETGENVSTSCIATAATTANVALNLPNENTRAAISPVGAAIAPGENSSASLSNRLKKMSTGKQMLMTRYLENTGVIEPTVVVNKAAEEKPVKNKIGVRKPGKVGKKTRKPKRTGRNIYEFDKILGHKYENKQYLYNVKWAGTSETTFEPLKNFSNPESVEAYLFGIINKT